MKQPIARFAVIASGVFAVLVGIAALVIGELSGSRHIPASAGWAIPLLAGGAVGLLSLFLLAGTTLEEGQSVGRSTVSCPMCGERVLEDWRLCPFCGGSNEPTVGDADRTRVSPHVGA
jgi:hypothetical protein